MFIAKIKHCPFGEPLVSEETMTEVTEITSEGMTYLQFCSAIGQIAFTFGLSEIRLQFVNDQSNSQK